MRKTPRFHLPVLAVGSILAASLSSSHAASILLDADADSFVNDGAKGVNYGQSEQLIIKTTSSLANNNRKAYIRFTLSDEAINNTITSASLNLTLTYSGLSASDPTFTFSVYGLNSASAGQDWVEGTGQTGVVGATPPNPIIWNNAPQNNTASAAGFLGGATLLGTFDVNYLTTVGTVVNFSNPALVSFLDTANSNVTLMIAGTSNGVTAPVMEFASRENTGYTGPQLAITTVPEPSTPFLLSLGVVAILYRRRRPLRDAIGVLVYTLKRNRAISRRGAKKEGDQALKPVGRVNLEKVL